MAEEKVINLKVDKDGNAKAESKAKTKLHNLGRWTKDKLSDAWNWACKNKTDLLVLVPLGLATIKGVKNMAPKKSVTQQAWERTERNFYDPHTMMSWSLTRPLKNWEKEELIRRQNAGESTSDILRSMRVLDR